MAGRGRGASRTIPAWMNDASAASVASARPHPTPAPAVAPQAGRGAGAGEAVNDWAKATAPNGRPYWFSRSTGKTTWKDPTLGASQPQSASVKPAAAKHQWTRVVSNDGRAYFYDKVSRKTQWDAPEGFDADADPGAPSKAGQSATVTGTAAQQPGAASATVKSAPHAASVATQNGARSASEKADAGGGKTPVATGAAQSRSVPSAAAEPLPPGWVAYTTPDGRPYFHNASLSKTVWKRPSAGETFAAAPAVAVAAASAGGGSTSVAKQSSFQQQAPKPSGNGANEGGRGPRSLAAGPPLGSSSLSGSAKRNALPSRAPHSTVEQTPVKPAPSKRRRTRAPPRGYVARPKDKEGGRYLCDREAERYFLGRAKKERDRLAEVDRKARVASGKGERGIVGARAIAREDLKQRLRHASEYVHVRKEPEETTWAQRERFETLMGESGVTGGSSWLETMARCTPDERYEVDITTYGHRKQAYNNFVAKKARKAREESIIAQVKSEAQFIELLDECFEAQPMAVASLGDCAKAAVQQFESDARYKAFSNEAKRSATVRQYFRDREWKMREKRAAEHRKLCDGLRARVDALTMPELRRKAAAGTTNIQEEANPPVRWLTERSSLHEVSNRVRDSPEFAALSGQDRADIFHAWLSDVKRAADDVARSARRQFIEGVERLLVEGDLSPRTQWPQASKLVLGKSFAKEGVEKGYIANDLLPRMYADALDQFYRLVDSNVDVFRSALKAAGSFRLSDETGYAAIMEIDSFGSALKDTPRGIVEALIYERRKLEKHRLESAVVEFEDLLARRNVDRRTNWEELKATLVQRTAYKQLRALKGSDEGVESVFHGVVERREERRRKRHREGNGHSALTVGARVDPGVKRFKHGDLHHPHPGIVMKQEEDSGWAAAISRKDSGTAAGSGDTLKRRESDRKKKEASATEPLTKSDSAGDKAA